jgi:hypothetical protein
MASRRSSSDTAKSPFLSCLPCLATTRSPDLTGVSSQTCVMFLSSCRVAVRIGNGSRGLPRGPASRCRLRWTPRVGTDAHTGGGRYRSGPRQRVTPRAGVTLRAFEGLEAVTCSLLSRLEAIEDPAGNSVVQALTHEFSRKVAQIDAAYDK